MAKGNLFLSVFPRQNMDYYARLKNRHVFFSFSGDEISDVVNCRNGVVVERFKVGDFWRGFESIKGLFAI